jgi:hypothetical protein
MICSWDIGFTEIEVGFPAASQTDFDFVRKIIDEGRDSGRRDHSGVVSGERGLDHAHHVRPCQAPGGLSFTYTIQPQRFKDGLSLV